MYLVQTEIERLFSTVYNFLSCFCWSVNYMSRVHIFFSDMLRKLGKVCIWRLLILSFLESSIPAFQHIFSFFSSSLYNCSSHSFSAILKVSKLCVIIPWTIGHISQMSRNISIDLYLRSFSIAIYWKIYLCSLSYCRLFLVCKLCKSGL